MMTDTTIEAWVTLWDSRLYFCEREVIKKKTFRLQGFDLEVTKG